jgi:AmmeMemoRadiSam system protein A
VSWATGRSPLRDLAPADRHRLLDVAEDSLREGLAGRGPLAVDVEAEPEPLRGPAAVFVTVTVGGELNGCTGTLEPVEPVAAAVARQAWQAGFDDPRLPQFAARDWDRHGVKVSILSALEPIAACSYDEFVAALRPGVDGVLLVDGSRRATFLPAVWDTLADADEFVRNLQWKGGITPGRWTATSRAWRYTTDEFGRST